MTRPASIRSPRGALLAAIICSGALAQSPQPLFDGKTLDGWRGDPAHWSVENGEIVGRTTPDTPLEHNIFLHSEKTWGDFELTLEIAIGGAGNSGIQYRSDIDDAGRASGYQADFDAQHRYSGILYEERGRGIVARRGEHVTWPAEGERTRARLVEGDPMEGAFEDGWNRYRIVAHGNRVEQWVNGIRTVALEDDHPKARRSGHIALQLHVGPPMEIRVRNIALRPLTEAPAWEPIGAPAAEGPLWIWAQGPVGDNQRVWLARPFELERQPTHGVLSAVCDNRATVFLDGNQLFTNRRWERPDTRRIEGAALAAGRHQIAVDARNSGGAAAFALRLTLHFADGSTRVVASDLSWRGTDRAPTGDGWRRNAPEDWAAVQSFGPMGTAPWGDPLAPRVAPDPATFEVAQGMAVDLVYSAQPGDGSWVALTFDPDGNIIVCPQSGNLRRFHRDTGKLDILETPVHSSQGFLYVGDAFFAQISRGKKDGGGLHRLAVAADGSFGAHTQIAAYDAGSEHGAHAILCPDGESLWMVQGNYTEVPEPQDPFSPFRNWAEDYLTERLLDPRGHANHVRMPAGRVLRRPVGDGPWTLYAGGMRNPYDIAFGPDGELFTFDADMEWDMGAPWYRPTRILHIVSGGEYGWRTGASKWPVPYPDSLPAVVDMGPGSPTGMVWNDECALPEPWRDDLFLGDWTHGRILAVDLQPDGASYSGSSSTIVEGRGLTITDLAFGPEGNLWFITGGRGTQTGLYRLRPEGAGPQVAAAAAEAADRGTAMALRALRHELEALHGRDDRAGLDVAWPHLRHADRFVRFAARTAVEHRPVALWRDRAFGETDVTARLTAMLALARAGSADLRNPLLQAIAAQELEELDTEHRLLAARVAMVTMARHGAPPSLIASALRRRFAALGLDASEADADARALAQATLELLVALDDPVIVARGLDALESSDDASWRMQIAYILREAKRGWDAAARDRFITWVRQAIAQEGGESLRGYIQAIAKDLRERLDEGEIERLDAALRGDVPADRDASTLRRWTAAEIEALLAANPGERDLEAGQRAYAAAQCASCHRHGRLGGRVGPDLSAVGQRFTRAELLTAILEPSKAISDQYRNTEFRLRDGSKVIGRVLVEGDAAAEVEIDPFTGARETVATADVAERKPSPVSPMPENLLGYLSEEQILDLIAFLSRGR